MTGLLKRLTKGVIEINCLYMSQTHINNISIGPTVVVLPVSHQYFFMGQKDGEILSHFFTI